MPKIRGIKPETWTDENFVELSAYARLLFIGLWNYACDNGHVEDKSKQIKMRILPTDDVNCAELLREIADQGMIERADGWITLPNLTEHQKPHKHWYVICEKPDCEHPEGTSYGYPKRKPTVEQPLTNSEPPVDHPLNNGGSTADGDVDIDGDVDVDKEPPSADAEATKAQALVQEREDVTRVCEHLADRIEANGSKRPEIGKAWHDAARLLMDRDGRDETSVHAAIEWCQSDDFWRANVMSMPKLRSQYDTLRLQAQRKQAKPSNGEVDWDAAHKRAVARDAQTRGIA